MGEYEPVCINCGQPPGPGTLCTKFPAACLYLDPEPLTRSEAAERRADILFGEDRDCSPRY